MSATRLVVGAGIALALGGVSPALAQQATHTAVDLGLLPGAFSNVAWGMNNLGEVVGWNQGPQATLRAYVWRPGAGIQQIPHPPGYIDSRADDISDTGYVVGSSNNGGATDSRAWRWRDGVFTLIPTIPGECASMMVRAVNDSGAVVGHTCDGSWGAVAFYYSDATGTINLGPLGINYVSDISNSGVVTGNGWNGNKYVPIRWQAPAGSLEFLPTLPAPYDDSARGEGINEAGVVVGQSLNMFTSGSSHYRAFMGTPAGVEMLSNPVTARSSAYAINELGQVVGTDGTTSTTDIYAWWWTPGEGKQFLTGTANGVDVRTVNWAVDINDAGQIIGRMVGPELPSGAVFLTRIGTPQPCYSNCDQSTTPPVLNVADFSCFLTKFAAGEAYANCDESTTPPTLNVADFTCFLTKFAAGCP